MINILKILLMLLIIALSACSSLMPREKSLILNYSDFGPPVIATELLGVDWWQWKIHGDSQPKHYDIKIIVYDGNLNKVKARYPVNPDEDKDFRYIETLSALKYLDDNIRENILESVTHKLTSTRLRIIEVF